MDRLHNPFTPGAGALPPELAGRAKIIEDGKILTARLLLGRYERSMLLIGLRGVGKTVLLRHLAENAKKDRVTPVIIEARGDDGDIEELSLRLKEALSAIDFVSQMKTSVNFAFSALRNFVKSFSINIGEFGLSVALADGFASSGRMEIDLSEVLVACGRAAKDAGTAIGLYVDELQNLNIEAVRGIIVALHRSAQEGLPLYLVGSGLPSIKGLIGKSKTYAERMFRYEEIGALLEPDSDAAITIPLNAYGISIDAEAISSVYAYTKGYPYFLQEFGYAIWMETTKPNISVEDVQRIAPEVERRLDENFFDVRFERVSNCERQALRIMADFPGESVPVAEVAARMERPISAFSPIRSSLIKKGMIFSPAHGMISYTVPLFGEYMRRVMKG